VTAARRHRPLRRPAARLGLAAVFGAATLVAFGAAPARAAAPDTGTEQQKASGKALYEKYCLQCHGDKGDGQGPAALHLRPMPRDFTRGKFKVRTTPNGSLPTHQDLKTIIHRGMPYTSMPAWPQFNDQQLSDLAYYVQSFSPDFANPELVPTQVEMPPAPKASKDVATTGRKLYEDSGCLRCHGDQGRGDGQSAPTLKDDWGHPIKPADLTERWTWRGGGSREDVLRTISTGFNGTPMPSYFDALTPEQRWQLADYISSLSPDAPHYATLITAKHLEDPCELETADEAFKDAPVARIPVVGQIMEPTRSFHPPVTSILVQAVYDAQSVLVRVRWNDMSAEKSGHNSPTMPVPADEEKEAPPTGGEAAPAEGGDVWGGEEAAPAAKAPAGGGDVWGEETGGEAAAGAVPASEFSDAVAVQWPLAMPTGARKPYFLFGDSVNPVDLWFMDLAQSAPRQYTGKGSADIAPSDTGDVTAMASYNQGEWTVTFKRPRTPTSTAINFNEGQFVPVAFSVWDGFTRERGNRRALTVWYHLYLEPSVKVSPVSAMLKTAAAVFAVEAVVIAWVRRRQKEQGTQAA